MPSRRLYDAIIVGRTSAGLTAAGEAVAQGLRVLLIDDPAARDTSDSWHDLRRELARLSASLRGQRSRLPECARALLSRLEVDENRRHPVDCSSTTVYDTVTGRCRIESPHSVLVDGSNRYDAGFVVIAAGTRERRPERFPFDDRTVCDASSALAPGPVPSTVTIVGADWVGCEWSTTFAALGAAVTLVDRRHRLLRFLDADLRLLVQEGLQEMGVTIALEEDVVAMRVGPHGEARVSLGSGRTELCDRVVVLAGRAGNTGELGLEEVGVEVDERGLVGIDDVCRTSCSEIFAVGAVAESLGASPCHLVQARLAVQTAIGGSPPALGPVPLILHTVPAAGVVGLSAEACRTLEYPHVVGSARTGVEGLEEIVHLVVDTSNRQLIGVRVAGGSAAELIHLGSLLLQRGEVVDDIASFACASGSRAELFNRAAQSAIEQTSAAMGCRRGTPASGG